MKALSEMTIEDKIAEANDFQASKNELPFLESYAKALIEKDEASIAEFEKYGDSVRQCCMNLYWFKKQMKFGWMDFEFGDYKWIKKPEFLDVERIEFKHDKEKSAGNSLEVGRGPNGVWTYGRHVQTSIASGSFSGLTVFGAKHKSKEEAVRTGCDEMLKWLNRRLEENARFEDTTNVNVSYTKAVIKMITERLSDKPVIQPVQLALFEF